MCSQDSGQVIIKVGNMIERHYLGDCSDFHQNPHIRTCKRIMSHMYWCVS